ncbi:hypothetical protein D3C84_666040 [compost metagenome]
MFHSHYPFLTGEAVGDVIAQGAGAAVLHRLAALLRGGVGVPRLHVALHLVAGVATGGGPGDGGDLLAAAATELVAHHAPEGRADHCAQDLVFILHRLAVGDGDVAALLARGLDGLGHRLAGQHLGKLGL